MAKFTAEQAFKQGKQDVEMATEAVVWFNERFGQLSGPQAQKVIALVLELRYQSHVKAGRLDPQ